MANTQCPLFLCAVECWLFFLFVRASIQTRREVCLTPHTSVNKTEQVKFDSNRWTLVRGFVEHYKKSEALFIGGCRSDDSQPIVGKKLTLYRKKTVHLSHPHQKQTDDRILESEDEAVKLGNCATWSDKNLLDSRSPAMITFWYPIQTRHPFPVVHSPEIFCRRFRIF